MRFLALLILSFISCLNVRAQNIPQVINSGYFHKDSINKLILINENLTNSSAVKQINVNASTYTLAESAQKLSIGKQYNVFTSTNDLYKLYVTELPIININTNDSILDEPMILGTFSISEPNKPLYQNTIRIEYRGVTSQAYPKKSLRIEFISDPIEQKPIDVKLLEMRTDDDWFLQALYIEPLRLRSKIGFDLWREIDTLHYSNQETEAINGSRMEFIELFLNNEYMGIYALSERIDRKQLQLKKATNDSIYGELYKGISWGATTYSEAPEYSNNSKLWSGFEYKYPSDHLDWSNIYDFVNFVIDENDIHFYQNYLHHINLDNIVNYYIFLNLLRATDNTGKNLYIAKYNTGEPYFFIPWDLEGSFGYLWNGEKESTHNDLLSNGLYDRLTKDLNKKGFASQLKKRWNTLRENTISANNIIEKFNTNFNYLQSNGVYEREKDRWPECHFIDLNSLTYTSNWLNERLIYLDIVFNNINTYTTIDTNIDLNLYPNPAKNYCSFVSNQYISKVTILNELGQIKRIKNINDSTGTINLVDYKAGVYFLLFEFTSGEQITKKVIRFN